MVDNIEYCSRTEMLRGFTVLRGETREFTEGVIGSFRQLVVLSGTANLLVSLGPIKRDYTISRGMCMKLAEGLEFTVSNWRDAPLEFIMVDFLVD